MGVAEGKVREHAALILKKQDDPDDGRYKFGQAVDPAFLALPFEEKARPKWCFQMATIMTARLAELMVKNNPNSIRFYFSFGVCVFSSFFS